MMEQNQKSGVFSVKRIKELSFTVDESLYKLNKQVRIQFQYLTTYDIDNHLVNLTLRVYYSYLDSPEIILVDLHVQNLFEVPNISQYQGSNNEFIFPKDLITAIVSMSISHTRSLLAKSISGTLYQDNILPIVNSTEITQFFFPHMFSEETETELKKAKATPAKNKKFK